MNKDVTKISLLAIAGGIFAVLVCNAQPYVLLAPIMSIIVGYSAQTRGNHKKNVNRMIVLIILTFLVVLPFAESHPQVISKLKVGLYGPYNDLLKSVDRTETSREMKTARTIPGGGNILEPANRGKATK